MKCWRDGGCPFNSNYSYKYMKCWQEDYSVEQCRKDNEGEWGKSSTEKDKIQTSKIIINARGGAGKDTFADYLVDNYGFKKIAFADGIYEIAYEYFGMTIKNRRLLQLIGEHMRAIDPLVWVKHAFKEAEKYDKVVISDCRRANEYAWAIERGYLPVHINTDLDVRIDRLIKRDGVYPDLELLENESEVGADGLDYITVDNNGTLEELYRQADEVVKFDWSQYIKEIKIEYQLRQMY